MRLMPGWPLQRKIFSTVRNFVKQMRGSQRYENGH